jgi:hypothetical protein
MDVRSGGLAAHGSPSSRRLRNRATLAAVGTGLSVERRKGHDLAKLLLVQVLRYAGASSLQVELIPRADSGRYKWNGSRLSVQPKSGAAGTYRRSESISEITYDASLLDVPADLIAVLAHETAHAILEHRTPK